MSDVLEATVLRVQSWTSRAKDGPVRLWRPRALPARAPAPASTPPRPRLADPPADNAASPLLHGQRGAGHVVSAPEAKLVVRARLSAICQARGSGLTGRAGPRRSSEATTARGLSEGLAALTHLKGPRSEALRATRLQSVRSRGHATLARCLPRAESLLQWILAVPKR